MRILFIVPYVPSLIRPRPYNLIKHLYNQGHEVTVLTLWSDQTDINDSKKLRRQCHQVISLPLPRWRSLWNCLLALPGRSPLQSFYCWQPALARQINTLVHCQSSQNYFDIVHVEHLRGIRYALYLKSQLANSGRPIPIVWDSVDCISYLFQQAAVKSSNLLTRLLTRFELDRTRQFEAMLLSQFEQVLVTSPIDKRELISNLPVETTPPSISILPNGVDLSYFKPNKGVVRETATLITSGKMSYHANISMVLHLVRDIMPHIWACHPNVKLNIVGKDPPREILTLEKNPLVSVTGFLNDIRPYLQKATLALAPLTYGAGIQSKILEAMACGTPVIATPHAISALDVMPGQDILVSNEHVMFAKTVLRMLDDSERRQEIGNAGRRYVEAHHQWSEITSHLERCYHNAINNKH